MTDLSNEIEFTIEKQARLLGSFSIECVIVGGVAATLHGSEIPTTDLDVCYARNPSNLEALATALKSVNARLRNAPAESVYHGFGNSSSRLKLHLFHNHR